MREVCFLHERWEEVERTKRRTFKKRRIVSIHDQIASTMLQNICETAETRMYKRLCTSACLRQEEAIMPGGVLAQGLVHR